MTDLMHEIMVIGPMISAAIVFIILITKMWTKSISTTIQGVFASLAMLLYVPEAPETSMALVLISIMINIVRAVIHTDEDRLIKRTCKI